MIVKAGNWRKISLRTRLRILVALCVEKHRHHKIPSSVQTPTEMI